MGRSVRFVPEGGALVEVTVRTIQSRLLLRPSPALNERVVGVLGRAQRLYGVRCCAVAFASNHYHALIQVDDAEQLARFMQYVDGNVAREVGDLVGWSGPFWARRYSAIVVSDEEAAQVERLRYILAHGVKENLVERVLDWPGVHAARSILEDKPLKGYWFDRTQEYAARNRGEEYGRLTYATEETFTLTRLPCWEHLSQEEYRERVAALVEEIEAEARMARLERGLPVLGIRAVLRQNPHTQPNKTKKSPAPRFHAASKAVRNGLREMYGLFLAAFRDAAELLKAGDRMARFPLGSFPPGLPFVRALPP
jgi:REP element-mobilizing transposase RayT